MKKILFSCIALLIIMLIYSCSYEQNKKRVINIKKETVIDYDSTTFQKYCNRFQLFKTPFTFTCGAPATEDRIEAPFKHYFDSDYEENIVIVGRVYPNNNFITMMYGIVGVDIYPLLFTYKNDGTKIDSLFLGGSCDGEPGYWLCSHLLFEENYTIIKTDTIKTYRFSSDYDEIPNTDTVEVFKIKYSLSSEGIFTKIDSVYSRINPQ